MLICLVDNIDPKNGFDKIFKTSPPKNRSTQIFLKAPKMEFLLSEESWQEIEKFIKLQRSIPVCFIIITTKTLLALLITKNEYFD